MLIVTRINSISWSKFQREVLAKSVESGNYKRERSTSGLSGCPQETKQWVTVLAGMSYSQWHSCWKWLCWYLRHVEVWRTKMNPISQESPAYVMYIVPLSQFIYQPTECQLNCTGWCRYMVGCWCQTLLQLRHSGIIYFAHFWRWKLRLIMKKKNCCQDKWPWNITRKKWVQRSE